MPRITHPVLAMITSLLLAVAMLPLGGAAHADASENVVPDVFLRAAINTETFNRGDHPITAAEMATVTHINHFSAGYIRSFEGLQYATSLEVLALHGATADLSIIASIPSLELLSITSPTLSDVSFLTNKPRLVTLRITTDRPLDLTPVSRLTGLTELDLENPSVNLTSLKPLTKLTALRVKRPTTADLTPLAGMTEMTELTLEGAGVSDLRPLGRMTKMQNLNLRDNAIKDISPIAGMKDIEFLYLEDNQISDVNPLSGLPRILALHLDANEISNVRPLAGLQSLKKLLVAGNRVTDLSPLSSLATRAWAGNQVIRVTAENGSRFTLPTLRNADATVVPWRYPSSHPSAGTPVPATVIVSQGQGLQRYEWSGTQFSGDFSIDVMDPTYPPTTPPATKPPTTKPGTVDVYTTPGDHLVNGRKWRTTCEKYSSTSRCTTLIEATRVQEIKGRFVPSTAYVFNNMTYLPAPRALWSGNPLATHGNHVVNGRKWRTECDTPVTGSNGCRSYIEARVIEAVPRPGGAGYTYRWATREVFNNIVRFS
ncbi:MAG: leucine-rich repeat domain-containing protein [Propionibacteriaceae bacterium]|nr:leucine-rich repeat domain-containing protein [Propionibacteriaceae bacterium]